MSMNNGFESRPKTATLIICLYRESGREDNDPAIQAVRAAENYDLLQVGRRNNLAVRQRTYLSLSYLIL